MITPFLTEAERAQYVGVPKQISSFDLLFSFHLSYEDLRVVRLQRRPANRLGFALQLGLLRFMGFLPESWMSQIPTEVISFVGKQIEVDPNHFKKYGQREATRTEHFNVILQHTGFQRWQPIDALWLEQWILERALEHDNERLLLEITCQKLKQKKVLRPAVLTLERLIATTLLNLDAQTYLRLTSLLTKERKEKLDALLEVDPATRSSPHRWLSQPAIANTPAAIKVAIRKIVFLQELGVAGWELSVINSNRRKRLASLARKRTSQAIRRYLPEKRYPLLVAFLKESYQDITDATLTMFGDYWEGILGKSRREMEFYQQQVVGAKDQTMQTLGKAAMLVVDEDHIPGPLLREKIYESVTREELLKAIDAFQALLLPTKHS